MRSTFVFCAISSLFGFSPSCTSASEPGALLGDGGSIANASLHTGVSPGGNFDLSHWSLEEPIGQPGAPTVILPAALVGASGFHDDYFFTDPVDGAMTFWAPENGVHWATSRFPRSELAERADDGTRANWLVAGTNVLAATVSVAAVPDHVCIGQIKAFRPLDPSLPSSPPPLLELYYDSTGFVTLGLENDITGGQTSYPIGKVQKYAVFQYEIRLTGDGTITVTLDGAASTFQMPGSFRGYGMYFKAGAYNQSTGSDSTVGAKVKFYALTFAHGA